MNDSKCIGVYDKDCDKIGVFRLCKRGFFTESSSETSCIHQKKIYDTGELESQYVLFVTCNWNIGGKIKPKINILL